MYTYVWKILNYFKLNNKLIKFGFKFKLLTHLTLLKLNCKVYFNRKILFQPDEVYF